MCGRARCTLDPESIARATGVPPTRWVDTERFHPSYNVSPGRYMPVLRRSRAPDKADEAPGKGDVQGEDGSGGGETQIHVMKWGLIPSFTKKDEKPDHFRMFNARSESLHLKSSFKRLLTRSRCVALVDGFYEWKKDGSKKQPYMVYFKDGRPLQFAALYDRWKDGEGNVMFSHSIVTTRSSKPLDWLHDRMPVILGTDEAVESWLADDFVVDDIHKLAKPYAKEDLVWHAVTPAMGKPSFDNPECVKEVVPTTAATSAIAQLFGKQKEKASSAAMTKTELDIDTIADEAAERMTADDRKAFEAGLQPDRDVSAAVEAEDMHTGNKDAHSQKERYRQSVRDGSCSPSEEDRHDPEQQHAADDVPVPASPPSKRLKLNVADSAPALGEVRLQSPVHKKAHEGQAVKQDGQKSILAFFGKAR
eukprot:SM000073S21475  [mRNA]  locus=s73:510672:513577:+ [translate_table: standard]